MTTEKKKARSARVERHAAIRAAVALEEAEASQEEAVDNSMGLDVPLHLRIDQQLARELRRLAAYEHIPTSALVRRILRQAVVAQPITVAEIEKIARRVAREELQGA